MRIIAGLFKNRTIKTPKGQNTRPTTEKLREAFFNMTQSLIPHAAVLDLFAGSGAIGIEALSRGADVVLFVDSRRESIQCIKENLALLQGGGKAEVRQGDVFALLERLAKQGYQFDLIYADPPYEAQSHFKGKLVSYGERVARMMDSCDLLKSQGMLFIEDTEDSKAFSEDMETLEFIQSRRFGRSLLHQFRKK